MNILPRTPEHELMDADEDAAYARADFSEVNALFARRLYEIAGARKNCTAIDLGAGPGEIAVRVAKARPDWQVTAFDLSPVMIEAAQFAVEAAELRNVTLLQGSACDTKLPAHSFDIIFSNSLLHHVNDAQRLWLEIKRLAAPGAAIFVRDLFRPESLEQAQALMKLHAGDHTLQQQELFYRSLRAAYTPEEIRAQLRNAGLQNLNVTPVTDRHVDIWSCHG